MFRYYISLFFFLLAAYMCSAQQTVLPPATSDTVIDSSAIALPMDDYDDTPEGFGAGRRNPIYYYGHNFSTISIEFSYLEGSSDRAWGAMVSYTPEVWGGYASCHIGEYYLWGSCGAEYRLSKPWSDLDWHLFGGVAVGDGVGPEIGIRLMADATTNHSKVGWIGGSLALRFTSGGSYCLLGLSMALSPLMIALF